MERNDINVPRFARSVRDALDGLALEARCYGWLDDPEYLEIKRYLECCLDSINGKEPTPFSGDEG